MPVIVEKSRRLPAFLRNLAAVTWVSLKNYAVSRLFYIDLNVVQNVFPWRLVSFWAKPKNYTSFQRLKKVDSRKKFRDSIFCKKSSVQFTKWWDVIMIIITVFQGKWFLLLSGKKNIHKIVVSDFWKYIKSINASSQNLGDIYWILSGEYLQNWHSDYVILI